MPEDTPEQKILDLKIVEAPEGVRITRDPSYGRSWIYVDTPADAAKPPKIVTEFRLRRREVRGLADASKAGPITAEHKRVFAKELRLDEKHMEVSPAIQKIADEICGTETNPVLQARKVFDFVIAKSEHYSKSGTSPKGLCLGDCNECLVGAGDCCTDQHARFPSGCRCNGSSGTCVPQGQICDRKAVLETGEWTFGAGSLPIRNARDWFSGRCSSALATACS